MLGAPLPSDGSCLSESQQSQLHQGMDKLPQYLIVNYSEVNVMFPEVQRVFFYYFYFKSLLLLLTSLN